MVKIKNKKSFAIIVFLSPIALIALFLIWHLVTSPIFDYFEKQKFITLDEESQKINTAIKAVAGPDDAWKYKTGCGKNYTGDWPDGTYQCISMSYMEKLVSSPEEVMQLHEKYYSVLEKQSSLVTKNEIEYLYGDTFGKKFVVSTAGKNYSEKSTGFLCRYEAYLGQSDTSLNSLSSEYGSEIQSGKGLLTMMINCEKKTNKAWYPEIKDASGMIPDFSPHI